MCHKKLRCALAESIADHLDKKTPLKR
jgi:hypothetical protein